MATDTRNLPAHFSGDADFRAWGSGISAQLAAVGLVKTTDTGQVNWATTTKPTTITDLTRYEIWRFNDSLQATRPVFIKMGYGATPDAPNLALSVATATDGAGGFQGQLGRGRIQKATAKTAGATLPSYCSGDASRLSLCNNLDPASPSYAIVLLVERTKTPAGADTGDGIATLSMATDIVGGGVAVYEVVPFAAAVPSGLYLTNMAVNSIGQATVVGDSVALSPTLAPVGKPLFASWCAYRLADLGGLTPVAVTNLGASHTYLPLGAGIPAGGVTQGNSAGLSLAMLWE